VRKSKFEAMKKPPVNLFSVRGDREKLPLFLYYRKKRPLRQWFSPGKEDRWESLGRIDFRDGAW
jgi:hypothetical protein